MSRYTTQYMPSSACDSLVAPSDSAAILFDYRAANAEELFSLTSISIPQHHTTKPPQDSNISQGTATGIIILICLYCWFVARFHKSIVATLKASVSPDDITMFLDNQTSDLRPFLRTGELIFFGSVALQFTVTFFGESHAWWTAIIMLAATIYLYFALTLKHALSLVVDAFDLRGGRFRMLAQISRFDITLFSIIACPWIIICSASPNLSMVGLSIIGLAVLIHWWRVLMFFKLAGFSILQWILYLCTLEVLPFTLIVGVMARLEI